MYTNIITTESTFKNTHNFYFPITVNFLLRSDITDGPVNNKKREKNDQHAAGRYNIFIKFPVPSSALFIFVSLSADEKLSLTVFGVISTGPREGFESWQFVMKGNF